MLPIASYTDPLKMNKIEVFPTPGGCKARVSLLDVEGRTSRIFADLPLRDIPKALLDEQNKEKLYAYIKQAHLIPEKGLDGRYNRVAVHISGLGGGNPSIPFQPGLALGSVVSGEILEKLITYAQSQATAERLEDQIKGIQQQLELLESKIASEKQKAKPCEPLIKLWEKQKAKVVESIDALAKAIGESTLLPLPLMEKFQQAIVSPIDMGTSVLETQPRSFDSENFSSQYILMSTLNEEIHDRINQSSSTSSFSGGGGWLFNRVQFQRTQSEAVLKRILDIKKENKAEGVLVINAFVTTRHVRCFTQINYDLSRLKQVLQAMQSANEDERKRFGITKSGKTNVIYLLTEAVQGGAFTALVTFLDEGKMKRHVEVRQKEESSSTSVSAQGGFWFLRARAGYASAGSSANKTEDDVLNSVAQTRINIEFFSQGALPTFTRNILEKEILKHVNLDPSRFELSNTDAASVEKIIKSRGQEQQIAILQQDMKMKNAQVGILNAFRGMTADKQVQNVHTLESVMGAYENFAEQMTTDKDCGIPVGFNYMVLTQEDIQEKIKELEGAKESTSKNSSTQPQNGHANTPASSAEAAKAAATGGS